MQMSSQVLKNPELLFGFGILPHPAAYVNLMLISFQMREGWINSLILVKFSYSTCSSEQQLG